MTTFVTIPNGDIDQDSPVTQPLLTALRDNPIAIAEADASVALGLFPTVLLGTIATTSGSTQTLSGLALTPYRHLLFYYDGVASVASVSSTAITVSLASCVVYSSTVTSTGPLRGSAMIDLASGVGISLLVSVSAAAPSSASITNQQYALRSSLSTASTSISISITGLTFAAGSLRIYGVK